MKTLKNFLKKRNTAKKTFFTLIELLAAMGVLTILMFVLISFFAAAQKAWTMSNARVETYENARIALDLIARDLQAIYYVPDKVPFWHVAVENSSWDEYRSNDLLAFISATPSPPNDNCVSNLCEIKYQKYYATNHNDSNDGWLRRSCTGDRLSGGGNNAYDPTSNPTGKWGFFNNFSVARTGDGSKVFTANSTSSEDFQKVIPYVVELSFTCYKKDGSIINKDTSGNTTTAFPYAVRVSLTLLDKASWEKWCALDDDPYHATQVLTADAKGTDESDAAWNFRRNAQRTFTKTIFIGERGQRY